MEIRHEMDDAIGAIENFSLDNKFPLLRLEFAEGDAYLGRYDNGEWEDNGDWDLGPAAYEAPGYEEWYVLDIHIEKVVVPGPNKDPRYEWIEISRKHMPVRVTAGDTVLYEE